MLRLRGLPASRGHDVEMSPTGHVVPSWSGRQRGIPLGRPAGEARNGGQRRQQNRVGLQTCRRPQISCFTRPIQRRTPLCGRRATTGQLHQRVSDENHKTTGWQLAPALREPASPIAQMFKSLKAAHGTAGARVVRIERGRRPAIGARPRPRKGQAFGPGCPSEILILQRETLSREDEVRVRGSTPGSPQ
jgi:hypothetical protein